jgi:hypothetical protein
MPPLDPPECNLNLWGLPAHQKARSKTPSSYDYRGSFCEFVGTRDRVIAVEWGPSGDTVLPGGNAVVCLARAPSAGNRRSCPPVMLGSHRRGRGADPAGPAGPISTTSSSPGPKLPPPRLFRLRVCDRNL